MQGELERAWLALTGKNERFTLAGRTDAGVNAGGQVASVRTTSELPGATLTAGLARLLPSDLWLTALGEAEPGFDARRSAVWREYGYVVPRTGEPLYGRWADVDRMEEAAQRLKGERDFAAVASEAPLGPRGSVRCVQKLDVTAEERSVVIAVRADAFLRQMVRRLVSALLFVGTGKIGARELTRAIDLRDRMLLPGPAPAEHLTLAAVGYGD